MLRFLFLLMFVPTLIGSVSAEQCHAPANGRHADAHAAMTPDHGARGDAQFATDTSLDMACPDAAAPDEESRPQSQPDDAQHLCIGCVPPVGGLIATTPPMLPPVTLSILDALPLPGLTGHPDLRPPRA